MDRRIVLPFLGEFQLLASQVQALNPILILLFAPLCTWGIYPALMGRGMLSARGKIVTGLSLAAIAFVIIGIAQARIVFGETPSILWQMVAYVVLTAAEVAVSITALELAYTNAPSMSRCLVTSFYLLSVSLGNVITAVVSGPCASILGGPETPLYFHFFALLCFLACLPLWLLLGRMRSKVEV
jgi:POT family proton-dependent oligopeptide transporter